MYLEKLTLKNFKCFSNQATQFGKITLLLGANSAGKSSLLYAILAALQSERFPLALSTNGPLIDLGDFTSVIFEHKKSLSMSLGLEFGGHQFGTSVFKGSFNRLAKTDMPVLRTSQVADPSFKLHVTRNHRYSARWTYESDRDPVRANFLKTEGPKEFFQSLDRLIRDAQKSGGKKQNVASISDAIRTPSGSGQLSFADWDELFPRLFSHPKHFLVGTHFTALMSSLAEFRSGFSYIGSVRLEPQRSYYYPAQDDLKVGRYGQNHIEQIAKWQEDNALELDQLRRALRSLRLVSNLQASRLKNGTFEIRVRPRKDSHLVSLVDVGLGIAEILPILVADLQLPKAGTLAVSQPESHLHPSAQSDLAAYLVRRVKVAKNRYVIETHSEYFMNRLRLLVAEGKLDPEDLSIIYLNNNGRESLSHRVSFLKDGTIEGAPKDFFQTYMLDVMNIALSATPK